MKKFFLRVMAIMLTMSMLFVVAGCGSGSGTNNASIANDVSATNTTAKTTDKEVVVSLLVKKLSSSFWTDLQSGVQDACKELGWKLKPTLVPIVADSNEEQIKLIEQDLLDPPDVYIICPADSKGIAPAIEQINKAGVPIINVNTRIADKNPAVKAFVGVDCRQIASQLAETMAKVIGNKGNMIILQGTTGAQTSIDYYEGALDVYKKIEDIVILDSQPANYSRQEGMTVTQNLLRKYNNIDTIYAGNLEMALGAVVAIGQAGRKNIKISTVNMSKEGAQALKDGEITAIADDDPYKVGYTSIKTAKDFLDGKNVPATVISPATMVVTGTDVAQKYYDKYGIK